MKSILTKSRKHDVTFHPSGKIDISAHIARRLNLSPGDIIDIAHEAGEWYIYVKLRNGYYEGRHEGRVQPTINGKGTFRTYSKAITKAVLKSAGTTGPLRCPCGSELLRENIKYITIIYRCLL